MTCPGSYSPNHPTASAPGFLLAQAAPTMTAAAPYQDTLSELWKCHGAKPVELIRTREGRDLSRARYRTAEEFCPGVDPEAPLRKDFLYFAGITMQLAVASHLLDVGFPDEWCARHVGLHVERSLAYANATGFNYHCSDTQKLATVLSPYWKWNRRSRLDRPEPDDGGFTQETVTLLLHTLLDHVRHVTGHRKRGLL
jgi:hypothetical protein